MFLCVPSHSRTDRQTVAIYLSHVDILFSMGGLHQWALSGICINCFFGEAGATIALTGGWAGGWHQMPDPDLHLDIIN